MHRTQVYFEPEVLELLREEAREKKTTLAAVIRMKVKKTLKTKIQKQKKQRMKSAAEVLIEMAKQAKKRGVKGPRDLSQRVDEFVYRT